MSEIKKLSGNIDFGANNWRSPSMTPLVKGAPAAARASVNTVPNLVTPLARAKLNEIGPATANVRAMIDRKKR